MLFGGDELYLHDHNVAWNIILSYICMYLSIRNMCCNQEVVFSSNMEHMPGVKGAYPSRMVDICLSFSWNEGVVWHFCDKILEKFEEKFEENEFFKKIWGIVFSKTSLWLIFKWVLIIRLLLWTANRLTLTKLPGLETVIW